MPKCRVMIWLIPVSGLGPDTKSGSKPNFFARARCQADFPNHIMVHLLEFNSEIHTRRNTGNTGCWIIHVYGIWASQLSCHHDTSGKPMKLVDIVQLIWSQISCFKAIAFRSWRKEGVPHKERIPYQHSCVIVENWARAATGADSSSFFWVLTPCCAQEAIRLQLKFHEDFQLHSVRIYFHIPNCLRT